ncbi:MAG TPA: nuclease-related domain-containing protein [Thermoclostridium caenicola]|uniref:nuclease-related domain-containing protein n=1 Tax=Thermoclostridium caenicola TaxID=659425 RepID=UPI002D18D0A1|nr:nuclease-related domain-containing protein [Thermoclostridium caenicola]HOK42242.1 nuclease-related domain-containing protein [Thermoclostridium caenicola]HOL84871.1 nuclease-related domain-containing protein [Thermoclostridium caenicola]HPO76084.1 nuclease-related domain-containing protein [Thermoclostridium caenicola]
MILNKIRIFFSRIIDFFLEYPLVLFFIIMIIGLYYFVSQIQLAIRQRAVMRKPSNETVQAFIAQVKRTIINNHPRSWNSLRQAYYAVKDAENVDFELRLKLCEVLQKKGVNGVHPPRQPHYLQNEEKIKQAGQEGEKKVAYALKWLDRNRFKVFANIRLSDSGEAQEFDSIVIGDKAVFNIEIKNYTGNLTIDQEGNWYRVVNGHKTGMENPVFQVKRHHKVLNNILEGKIPIVDLIVWANIESVIEGAQYSLVKVIKVDQLTHFIENYDEGRSLSKEETAFAISRIQSSMQKS